MVHDDALPQLPTLLGPDARALLSAALEPAGVEVLDARASHVRYDPGRRVVVRYATRVREGGAERIDTLVAVADRRGPPEGVALLEGPDGVVGVWRYPNDPRLPGLRSLVYPEGARHVLAQLGLSAVDVVVEPVVYRPGQRAVLRIRADGAELFAKLVRPERAERIHRAHQAFAGHPEVPRSLGWSAEHGLVVLAGMPGERLAERLSVPGPVPPPAKLLALLDRLAGADLPAQGPTPSALPEHARLVEALLPAERALVREIAGRAQAATAGAPADRVVHGDFYEGQLLVRGARVVGLLDVDTAHRGAHLDDLATMLGHLDGLALVRPASARGIRRYRAAFAREAAARVPREVLETAVAGVLLGLATGPFRLQEPDWPERTRAWLRLARAALPLGAGAGG